MKLHDFVKQYNVVSPEACKALINVFEESKSFHVLRNDDVKNFRELNINEHSPELIELLVSYTMTTAARYLNDLSDYNEFFALNALEEFRIKRYTANSLFTGPQQFRTHVDVGDPESAKRQLAFLFYLNDDFEGGETEFDHGLIKPKEGDILVFPPTWQYPHAGLPVKDGTKYIISTYLHYV